MSQTLILVGPGEHFGLHIVRRFAAEGFHVLVAARNPAAFTEALREEGVSCGSVSIDVTNAEDLAEKLAQAARSMPPVTCVIYNVKAGMRGSGLAIIPKQLNDALAVNVGGALATVQAAVPLLAPGASFIVTGGGYKDAPDPQKCILATAKGALHSLVLSLVAPLRERGIAMKTVVIDGFVRDEGPIRPGDVAEQFWQSHTSSEVVTLVVA